MIAAFATFTQSVLEGIVKRLDCSFLCFMMEGWYLLSFVECFEICGRAVVHN